MEHYLGEKLKKLRESRGWTQADLAKRLNKAVSTVSGYESDINEQEAEIVRLIFDKYVYEGYGAQRIATYLNNAGYRARSGKCWHPGSLRGMVGNLTYMGVLRCGDGRYLALERFISRKTHSHPKATLLLKRVSLTMYSLHPVSRCCQDVLSPFRHQTG